MCFMSCVCLITNTLLKWILYFSISLSVYRGRSCFSLRCGGWDLLSLLLSCCMLMNGEDWVILDVIRKPLHCRLSRVEARGACLVKWCSDSQGNVFRRSVTHQYFIQQTLNDFGQWWKFFLFLRKSSSEANILKYDNIQIFHFNLKRRKKKHIHNYNFNIDGLKYNLDMLLTDFMRFIF